MQRLLQALSLDPVADPECHIADDPCVVHVPDCRMIQSAERLGFAQKPRAYCRIFVEVDPETDPPLEDQVICLEQNLLGRSRNSAFQAIAVPQNFLGPLEIAVGLYGRQRSSPRRRSTLTSRPHTAGLHQRRL